MKRISVLIGLCCMVACRQNNTVESGTNRFAIDDFKTCELPASSSKVLAVDDFFMANPGTLAYHEDGYLLVGDNRNTKILSVIDLRDTTYSSHVTRGRAQNEIVALWDVAIHDGDIYLSSLMDKKVLKLRHNKATRTFTFDTTYVFANQFLRCQPFDGGFVSLASASSGDRFNVWNENAEILDTLGGFPSDGLTINGVIHNGVLQSDMIVSLDGQYVVTAYKSVDYIDVYKNFELKSRLRGPECFDVEISSRDIGNGIVRTTASPTVFTYHNISSAKNGFYVGYVGYVQDGNKLPTGDADKIKRIMHFSWDGAPLEIYILEEPVDAFTVDSDGKTLYCLRKTEEPTIVEYALS